MNIQCIKCKGSDPKNNCGRSFCPLVVKSEARFKVQDQLKSKDFQGSSPAPFIGRFGYPYVNVGFLSPPDIKENAWEYDSPRYWAQHDYQIQDVIGFRSELINSNKKAFIKGQGRTLEIAQEIGMASAPVDLEVNLEDKPKFQLKTDSFLAPQGPSAKLKKATVTANPKIHNKVDRIVGETDLKAVEGLTYLFDQGFDENFLSKLLSVSTLGLKKNRKLVPTRYSITAVDDTLGKNLIKKIKDFPSADYSVYFGGYLGNYYLFLFFPEIWSYELFETYMPHASWNVSKEVNYTTDYEPYGGRKSYADNCAGGYYAARLPLLEKLNSLKRQSSVMCIRIITGEYYAPLGVFVVREAARKSLQNKPLSFGDKELMIRYVKELIRNKFGFDINFILKESVLLDKIKNQRNLTTYI